MHKNSHFFWKITLIFLETCSKLYQDASKRKQKLRTGGNLKKTNDFNCKKKERKNLIRNTSHDLYKDCNLCEVVKIYRQRKSGKSSSSSWRMRWARGDSGSPSARRSDGEPKWTIDPHIYYFQRAVSVWLKINNKLTEEIIAAIGHDLCWKACLST